MKKRAVLLATLAAILQGCSSWWPFGSSGGEGNRVPPGAIDFACADGKRLFVRLLDDGKAAWVILPDREFRLERSGTSDTYSNSTSTLSLVGDNAHLDIEGNRQFADCKRKAN